MPKRRLRKRSGLRKRKQSVKSKRRGRGRERGGQRLKEEEDQIRRDAEEQEASFPRLVIGSALKLTIMISACRQ